MRRHNPLNLVSYRLIVLFLAVIAVSISVTGTGSPPVSANIATDIAAGSAHTCVLTSAGGVKCWGSNWSGQIGIGTVGGFVPNAVTPVGLQEGVASIAAGGSHTCVIAVSGALKCWGSNRFGQLGDGTTIDRAEPTDVIGLQGGVIQVAPGVFHTCALLTDDTVKCWGRDSFGQLGVRPNEECDGLPIKIGPLEIGIASATSGPEPCALTPLTVNALGTSIATLSGGGNNTCAVTTSGGVKCWGGGSAGALGRPATESCFDWVWPSPCERSPVDVCVAFDEIQNACSEALTGAQEVAMGGIHTCALMSDGTVRCWGINTGGELGERGQCIVDCPPSPVCQEFDASRGECRLVLNEIQAIGAGSGHSCALTREGGVKCWGDNLINLQLGDAGACGLECPLPTDVCSTSSCDAPLSGAAALSVGGGHSCAVTFDGGVQCWGANGSGQLGADCCRDQGAPVTVERLGAKLIGDADCDGETTSLDAALVLQLTVNLVDSLQCQELADMNDDGLINSVDALLILQIVAGKT